MKATVPLLQQSATHLKILQYLYIISYFKPVGEFFFFFLGGLLSLSRGVVGVLVLAAGAFWGVAGVLVLTQIFLATLSEFFGYIDRWLGYIAIDI